MLPKIRQIGEASGESIKAIQLFEEAACGIERRKFQHYSAEGIVSSTIHCYEQLGDLEKAETWRRKWLVAVKEKSGTESTEYAAALFGMGSTLLLAQRFSEAESVLRESLAIRDKKQPDTWVTFNTKSLLGGALLGQKRYVDAEPLLIGGYEGMQKCVATIPDNAKPRLDESLERVARLYDEMGQKNKAEEWRKKLAALQAGQPNGK
jgi:tetratricopeptide (TPR) repeat protein